MHKKKGLSVKLAEHLSGNLDWVLRYAGLAKLLAIREFHARRQIRELPLTKEDASRIGLIQDVVQPRDGIRPNIGIRMIKAHWVQIPARLILFGPVLDLVNAFREQQQVKVCWNCGKLYRAYDSHYHREIQRYCSGACRKRAQTKRRYQRSKETERKTSPQS